MVFLGADCFGIGSVEIGSIYTSTGDVSCFPWWFFCFRLGARLPDFGGVRVHFFVRVASTFKLVFRLFFLSRLSLFLFPPVRH